MFLLIAKQVTSHCLSYWEPKYIDALIGRQATMSLRLRHVVIPYANHIVLKVLVLTFSMISMIQNIYPGMYHDSSHWGNVMHICVDELCHH